MTVGSVTIVGNVIAKGSAEPAAEPRLECLCTHERARVAPADLDLHCCTAPGSEAGWEARCDGAPPLCRVQLWNEDPCLVDLVDLSS